MFEKYYRYVKDEELLKKAYRLLQSEDFEASCEIIDLYGESYYRAIGTFKERNYRISSVLVINYDDLYRFNCQCNTHYYRNHYCEHFICMIAVVEQFYKDHPISYTNRSFLNLMNRSLPNEIIEKPHSKVHLQPILSVDDEGENLSVSYKIGESKMYVVKNLSELVHRMKKHESYSYGKNFGFVHDTQRLDELSLKNYELIQQYVEITESFAKDYFNAYTGYTCDVKRDLPLTGKLLDDFFELNLNQDVGMKLSTEFEAKQIALKQLDEYYEFELPNYYFIQGKSYTYIYHNNTLYRVDSSYDELRILFNQFHDNGPIKIDQRDIRTLYNSIVPKLDHKFELVTNFDDENYRPVKPKIVFQFDYIDEMVTCNYELSYRSQQYRFNQVQDQEIRNLPLETRLSEFLVNYFMTENEVDYYIKDDDSLLYLIQFGIDELNSLGVEVVCTNRFDRIRSIKKPNVNIGISLESNLLNFDINIEGTNIDEINAILSSYRLKKKYHRLTSGQFLLLEDEQLDLLDEIVGKSKKDLKALAEGNLHMPIYRSIYLDKLLEENEGVQYNPQQAFKQLVNDFDEIKNTNVDLPVGLNATLREYQKTGYEWLLKLHRYHFGGILADDMGLGKTLQIITLLLKLKGKSPYPALVVCPASLVYNWESEIKRFAPELSVMLMVGSQKQRVSNLNALEFVDVVVTSYDLLKRDITYYEGHKFSIQVIDEAQFIKNANTLQTKAVKAIQADQKFALSGTPIENRLSELWSIFDYLMPGFLYNYETFRNEFETPIMKNQDEKALARLQKMVGPFILRRNKKDVLKDLPDKIEKVMYAKMESKQEDLYQTYAKRVKLSLSKESDQSFKMNKITILKELTRLRQLCCDPSLFLEDYKGSSCKLEQCLELVQSGVEGNHKILIFSQFKSMLDIIAHELACNNISYYMISGETSKESRIQYVNSFNQDQTPVFLISLKAGGTGLNLTAADIVIHFDPWWNEAAMNQATDRAHRIGQQNVVTVYKMITKDTIEEKILQLQESKSELASSILEGSSTSMASLSREDLLDILQ